ARLGMTSSTAPLARFPELVQRNFEIVLDEYVPVWSVGLGGPGAGMVRRCHERGIKVIAMVTNVADARTVAGAGVDAVVAQGIEAGGHRSNWSGGAGEAGQL